LEDKHNATGGPREISTRPGAGDVLKWAKFLVNYRRLGETKARKNKTRRTR